MTIVYGAHPIPGGCDECSSQRSQGVQIRRKQLTIIKSSSDVSIDIRLAVETQRWAYYSEAYLRGRLMPAVIN